MIDEVFLESAVRIRRDYLKISNNMGMYHKRSKEILDMLNDTITKIDSLQEEIEESKKESRPSNDSLNKLIEILKDVEQEGEKLERLAEPLNKKIEELAKEEKELYRQIKSKHNDLSDQQIIESVKNRLEKENLS